MRPFLWNEEIEGGIEEVTFSVANLHGHYCILVNGRVMSESEAKQMVDVLNNYCQMTPIAEFPKQFDELTKARQGTVDPSMDVNEIANRMGLPHTDDVLKNLKRMLKKGIDPGVPTDDLQVTQTFVSIPKDEHDRLLQCEQDLEYYKASADDSRRED